MEAVDAIRLTPDDNVATVLRPIAAGQAVAVRCGTDRSIVIAVDPIPLCHKISVIPIEEGQAVIKYGQGIGHATASVMPGRHVHIHNLVSARARAAS